LFGKLSEGRKVRSRSPARGKTIAATKAKQAIAVVEASAIVANCAGAMVVLANVPKIRHGVPISTTSGVNIALSNSRPERTQAKPSPAVAKTGITAARIGPSMSAAPHDGLMDEKRKTFLFEPDTRMAMGAAGTTMSIWPLLTRTTFGGCDADHDSW